LLITARVEGAVLQQIIHGTVLVASVDERGATISLSPEQHDVVMRQIRGVHRYAVEHGLPGRGSEHPDQ
jgi:hypothetical protein